MSKVAPKVDVVVVGAGCAGLRAASVLCRKHERLKVLVLEAREDTGGRVRNEKWNDRMSVDLGASFMHYLPESIGLDQYHRSQHPLLKLTDELGIDLPSLVVNPRRRAQKMRPRAMLIFDRAKRTIIKESIFRDGCREMSNVLDRLSEKWTSERKDSKRGESALDDVLPEYDQLLAKLSSEMMNDTYYLHRCMDYSIARFECYEGGLEKIGVRGYGDDESDGRDIYGFDQFGWIIEQMKEKLINHEKCRILCNSKVNKIEWDWDNNDHDSNNEEERPKSFNCKVHFSQKCDQTSQVMKKDEQIRTVLCRYVICAVPVWCIQQDCIEFSPSLHPSISRHLSGFNDGILNCCVVEFSHDFPLISNHSSDRIKKKRTLDNLVVLDDYLTKNKDESKKDDISNIPGKNQKWGPIFRVSPSIVNNEDDLREWPNVWKAYLTPHFCTYDRKRWTDRMIIDDLVSIFRCTFEAAGIIDSDSDFPSVKKWKITRWDSEEFTRGGWALWGPDSEFGQSCEVLSSERIDWHTGSEIISDEHCSSLLFAGDYTQSLHIGTVNAALDSGTRAAEQILDAEMTQGKLKES